MPKITLEFDLDKDFEELAAKRATNATNAYIALSSIANEIFRANRKHGYSDPELFKMWDDPKHGEAVQEFVDKLEELFYQILNSNDINLDDLE